jgi:hypothetical protein
MRKASYWGGLRGGIEDLTGGPGGLVLEFLLTASAPGDGWTTGRGLDDCVNPELPPCPMMEFEAGAGLELGLLPDDEDAGLLTVDR